MIEPKAGTTAGLGVTRSCSAGRFCDWRWHSSGAHASRERIFVALTPRRRGSPPPCGEGLGVGVERFITCGDALSSPRDPPPYPPPQGGRERRHEHRADRTSANRNDEEKGQIGGSNVV